MGRVVMLGTPHGGSEVADWLQDNPAYQFVFGPAGQELTTTARGTSKVMPWYDLGMVAGTAGGLHPLGAICINGEHDGCVSVESTRIEGMKDHIILPVYHAFMTWTDSVNTQVQHFLQHGVFAK
jgi:hypothetical protein